MASATGLCKQRRTCVLHTGTGLGSWLFDIYRLSQALIINERSAVPPQEVISLKQLNIIGPDGQKKLVNNPLLAYTFHRIDPSFPEPYSEWKTTLRHPTPQQGPNAKSNVQQLKA